MLYIVVQLLACVGFVAGVLMFWSSRTPPIERHAQSLPTLSIIIPARNEALRLPPLLQSLHMQNWQHFEIIVVDDGSSDQTAAVAASYGARLLKSKQVRQMKQGKSNACAYGARFAAGEWLLFLDADVQLAQEDSLLTILTSFHRQAGKGILSIQPYHSITERYENLSVIFNIIVITGMNVFTVWKDKFVTAGSFGPCILCDRASYERTGGHEAAAHSIMDDFALSDVFFAKKLAVTNYLGKGLIQMRMYEEGTKQLMEGWTKNLATASQSTHPFVMLLIRVWIFGIIMGTLAPIVALAESSAAVGVSIALYILYGVHVYSLARRAGDFDFVVLVAYPLYVLFFIVIFGYSLFRTHVLHSVTWKGRKIKV